MNTKENNTPQEEEVVKIQKRKLRKPRRKINQTHKKLKRN